MKSALKKDPNNSSVEILNIVLLRRAYLKRITSFEASWRDGYKSKTLIFGYNFKFNFKSLYKRLLPLEPVLGYFKCSLTPSNTIKLLFYDRPYLEKIVSGWYENKFIDKKFIMKLSEQMKEAAMKREL